MAPDEARRKVFDHPTAELTLIVREAIRQTFFAKGELHADDLADLGIPAEHLPAIVDEQIARLVNAKLVTAEGDVYKPTELGQRKLDGLAGVAVNREEEVA